MQTQTTDTGGSIDNLIEEVSKRIARVIVAKTMQELFSQGASRMISGEITDPSAILTGGRPAAAHDGGRRMRRSSESVDADVERLVSALRSAEGHRLRAEELRAASGMDKAAMLLPLRRGLETGAITKTGQKRATTYALGGVLKEKDERIPAREFSGKNVIRRKRK